VPSALNASPVVKTLDLKQIHFLVGYFDPRLPDLGAFLKGIFISYKMSRPSFPLHLEIGFGVKYSGFHTVAEIRNYCEIELGNTVSVYIIIIIIIY
jgi:hypothetical protein